jgi:hypothetical protein
MKTTKIRYYSVVFVLITMIIANSSIVMAHSQDDYYPTNFFQLQFDIQTSYNISQIMTPFKPGETREVDCTISYRVAHSTYLGAFLLHFLIGKSFPISVSVEYTFWFVVISFSPANLTGVIPSDTYGHANTTMIIHVDDNASGAQIDVWNGCLASVKDIYGPFKIVPLIDGEEDNFLVAFQINNP